MLTHTVNSKRGMEYETFLNLINHVFKGYQSSAGNTSIEDNYLCLGHKYFKNHLGPTEFSLTHPWKDEHSFVPPQYSE